MFYLNPNGLAAGLSKLNPPEFPPKLNPPVFWFDENENPPNVGISAGLSPKENVAAGGGDFASGDAGW